MIKILKIKYLQEVFPHLLLDYCANQERMKRDSLGFVVFLTLGLQLIPQGYSQCKKRGVLIKPLKERIMLKTATWSKLLVDGYVLFHIEDEKGGWVVPRCIVSLDFDV